MSPPKQLIFLAERLKAAIGDDAKQQEVPFEAAKSSGAVTSTSGEQSRTVGDEEVDAEPEKAEEVKALDDAGMETDPLMDGLEGDVV